jgi:predicted RNase H-like HicB family nuclease
VRQRDYVAVIHKDGENGFSALFPDFPGVVTTAPTLDEAIKRSGEALALHAERMVADGKAHPAPTGLSLVLANPDYRTAVLALVRLEVPER